MLTLPSGSLLRPSSRVLGALGLISALSLLAPLAAHADNENLALGNPSAATASAPDNRLIEHPEFALSYNQKNGGPNWVSWHLSQSDRGRSGRGNDFRPDPLLPEAAQIRPTDYRGSGYDRGHQCPSADRTADKGANSNTFLMSNMLPQTPDLNRQLWRKFEEYCRSQLRGGGNEIYLITGGVGSLARIADDKVNVPASCWKVAVILPTGENDLKRIDKKTRVIAVLMPNQNGPDIVTGSWRTYLTSVDKIEAATKLDLLSKVPVKIQKMLEAKVDSGRATNSKGGDDEEDETDG